MRLKWNTRFTFIALLVSLGLAGSAYAENTLETEVRDQNVVTDNGKASNTRQQLVELITAIETSQKELANVKAALSKAKDELDAKALRQQRDKLSERIQSLQKSFEAIAASGADIDIFEQRQEAMKFDWQAEVKEILRPIANELKRLTERPRTIERLRTEKEFLSVRLPVADSVLERIRLLKENTQDQTLLSHLQKLEGRWKNHRNDIANQLRLVTYQLDEILNPPDEVKVSIVDQIKGFFSGRGLNILYAIAAFVLVYLFFKFISRAVRYFIGSKKDRETRIFEKAMQISFRVLAVLLSIFAVIIVFYIQGDWFLLGLGLIFLIGFAWTLRQSLPRFIAETKLLLNLGPVRENERVIYNGVPWRVTTLNLYTTLTNPALAGGTVHLPARVVLELQSRRFSKEEPWFPSRPGDYVMLNDGIFGSVTMQTPEIVTMEVRGGSTKTYATTDYLAQNPKNISHGFGVFITFGFDYADQKAITSDIPEKLTAFLQKAVSQEAFFQYLKELRAEFKEAAASSLNLLIITKFEGKAADSYYTIDRFLQRAAVDACNHYEWNIPFSQLTVHLADKE